MANSMLDSVKLSLGVSHTKKDTLFKGSIMACLKDLQTVGIVCVDDDPLVQLAVQMYCHSLYDPDTQRRVEFKERYNDLKGTMKGAAGYSREVSSE